MEKKTTRPGLGHRKARLRRNADGGPNLLLWGGLAVGGYIAYRWLMGSKSDKASVSIAPVVGAKAPAMPGAPPAAAKPDVVAPPAMFAPPAPPAPPVANDWNQRMTVEDMDATAKSADPTKSASGIGNYYNEP